ncbi:MAG: hypothetical protein CL450_04195 [Acidimicrobiaceae bacterium]|nr:hypothetical protein [Acidimicrobiaceae bacterium]|tara:strand:+ start:1397 stop:1990 length:594 start_codon:yes stop_codon:yes gene_type:complete
METVFYIDPHTLAVREVQERTCIKCKRCLPDEAFYVAPRGRCTKLCRRCYDRKFMAAHDRKTFDQHIAAAVGRANRRSRVKRSKGPPIDQNEALQLWKACESKCSNCRIELVWEFNPRTRNLERAVLDRIDTSKNKSYHGNAQWLCTVCNEDKGGWDLAVQMQHEVERLRRRLKRARKKRKKTHLYYADILISSETQ